jgi:hypothetical protein
MELLAAVSKTEEDAEDVRWDPASGEHVSAWSGSADGFVVDFQHWLQRRGGPVRREGS